jgi:hypothetical protein
MLPDHCQHRPAKAFGSESVLGLAARVLSPRLAARLVRGPHALSAVHVTEARDAALGARLELARGAAVTLPDFTVTFPGLYRYSTGLYRYFTGLYRYSTVTFPLHFRYISVTFPGRRTLPVRAPDGRPPSGWGGSLRGAAVEGRTKRNARQRSETRATEAPTKRAPTERQRTRSRSRGMP